MAGIGYGTKSDFTKQSKGKTPYYDLGSDFSKDHPHAPCWTFGESRSKYSKVFCEANKMLDMNVPGPGKYNFVAKFGNDAKKYSIAQKFKDPAQINKDKYPGPAQYSQVQLKPEGKYFISNYKNLTGIVWSYSKSKRENDSS